MRGRPLVYDEPKKVTSISIAARILNRAKEEHLNISYICEKALAKALNEPMPKRKLTRNEKAEILKEKIKHQPISYLNALNSLMNFGYTPSNAKQIINLWKVNGINAESGSLFVRKSDGFENAEKNKNYLQMPTPKLHL